MVITCSGSALSDLLDFEVNFMYRCTEKRFLADVDDHEITVINDDGVNRHLRFKAPGTICYYFDLITWPGHLCVTGDCGTYVFQRVEDMFKFFRGDGHNVYPPENKLLSINSGYWAEKVLSVDKQGKIEEFSSEEFEEAVKAEFDIHCEDSDIDLNNESEKKALWQEIKDAVLCFSDNEHEALSAVWNFEYEGFTFVDWEYSCKEYTFRYIWNLYAIVYGINEYDKLANG